MTKIYAPNSQYNGESASVKFENGVGETDDMDLIGWFREHGYEIEADSTADVVKATPAKKRAASRKAK